MKVLAIHATDKEVAEQILASGFKPGSSLANYLGEGAYFYLVHGEGGFHNAVDWATRVARRRFRTIAFLAAEIDVEYALHLQNPVIRPHIVDFSRAFDRRLLQLGLCVEPNDNASYYRPVSHLTIEAFRRAIEAISGCAFDVLSARFALKSRDIDNELPYELCVKRRRAIASIRRCQPFDRACFPWSDPATWSCADSVVQAAQHAARLVAGMDDRDLFDLIASIYQGSDGTWAGAHPRFAGLGPVHFIHDSRDLGRTPDIARMIEEAGQAQLRPIEPVDLAELSRSGTSHAQALIGGLLEKTAGIVALLGPEDAEVASLVVTVAERRPEVPILSLLAPSRDVAGEVKPPVVMRSRHNLCCVALWPTTPLGELIEGFLHDRWTDALAIRDIESKMAARHGKSRRRDARKIVEAYHARKRGLI